VEVKREFGGQPLESDVARLADSLRR